MSNLPPDLEAFKVILQGGDARNITDNVLTNVVDKVDSFLDTLSTESAGTPAVEAAVNRALAAGGFSNLANEGLDQVKFAGEIRELMSKAQGAAMGEDLEDHIGDTADYVKSQITTNYRNALGRGNKGLASKVVAALNKLIRKYGEDAKMSRSINANTGTLTATLNKLLKGLMPAPRGA